MKKNTPAPTTTGTPAPTTETVTNETQSKKSRTRVLARLSFKAVTSVPSQELLNELIAKAKEMGLVMTEGYIASARVNLKQTL